MNFSQFLLILKARWLIAGLALLVTVATTVAVSLVLPPAYTATASLVVDAKAKDPVTGTLLPAQLLPGYLATQVDILKSQNVALRVVDGLKLTQVPSIRQSFQDENQGQGDIRYWMADLLLKKLDVQPSRESSVVQVNFEGTDPKFAAIVANAFAQAYVQTNLEMRIQPAKATTAWYEEQVKVLRDKLEVARTALSDYQRQKGLVAPDERIDVETARLAELSSQLVAAQAQTYDTTSRQAQSGNSLAEVEQSPLVQNLKAEVARSESNLSQLAEKVGKNHPQYQRAQAELESLRAKLDKELKSAVKVVSTTARVAQGREGDIRAALAAQKARVMSLKQQRDEAALLVRDVENAQQLYDVALQRYGQTRLESEATQTDIAILNPAIAPLQPSSPKVVLNTILSVFLGSLLGIGLAFLMEMLDRRVRSAEDLLTALDVPVLGELGKLRSGRSRLAQGGLYKPLPARA